MKNLQKNGLRAKYDSPPMAAGRGIYLINYAPIYLSDWIIWLSRKESGAGEEGTFWEIRKLYFLKIS